MPIDLKRNSAAVVATILSHHMQNCTFTDLLQDKEKARELYKDLGWFESGSYFGDIASEILSGFTIEQSNLLKSYLVQEVPLHEVCIELIKYIANKNFVLDREKLYSCLIHYASIVHKTVQQILLNKRHQKNINILGFGLRDGQYEQQISQFLVEKQIADASTVYGFDPDSSEIADKIIMLDPQQLLAPDCPKFDVVLIRWVLHHINYKERWNDLINCLNQCRINAKIIIIEEGCFPTSSHNKKHVLTYELLLGCADVIINFALHPQWMKASVTSAKPFFLEYLTSKNIEDIQNALKIPTKRSIIEVGSDFFTQTLITYEVKSELLVKNNSIGESKLLT